jgi:threonine dehydrogenase-like Zn-dependent dehydrogenase
MGEGVIAQAGLIGAPAARLARLAGCRPSRRRPDRRVEVARLAGIVAIDPEGRPADVHRGLADGRLPEIVVEATGDPTLIARRSAQCPTSAECCSAAREAGRDRPHPLSAEGISVSAHARLAPSTASPFSPFTLERNKAYTIALAAEGSLSTEGLVSHHALPEQAPATYRALAERAKGYMGVVVDWKASTG